jgi:hypothetical protein
MNMQPQKAKGKFVRYQPSIITYVDILGFRRLVQTKQAGEISRILRVVKETVAPGKELSELLDFRIQHFSDLTVRVLPIVTGSRGHGDVFAELLSLVYVQKELIETGILVRGSIMFGDIVTSWGLLYGPGLIRAYELEQEAVFPKIIVDHNLLRELRRNPSLRGSEHDYKMEMEHINKLIRKDSDNSYFVDYLRAVESEFNDPEVGYPHFLNTHKNEIVRGLNEFKLDKRVLRKYRWLKAYHNSTVKNRFASHIARRYII